MSDESNTTRMTRYIKEDDRKEENTLEEQDSKKNNDSIQKENKPKSLVKRLLIFLLFVIILVIVYSCTLGKYFIDVKEYKVESPTLPSSFHGLKIVQFSDIHYGTSINKEQLNKVVKKINNLNPDIIMFTGNLIDNNITITESIETEITECLSSLNTKAYKYAIYGNEDHNYDKYKDMMSSLGFTVLDNEIQLLFYEGPTPILIGGFNTLNTNPNYNILSEPIDDIDPNSLFRIVLTHEPDAIDNFLTYSPNLVLAGHSLGGLINLPLLKPLFLPDQSQKYYQDYYHLNNTEFYISSGLGTTGINARLNNHPSISLYRLYQSQ